MLSNAYLLAKFRFDTAENERNFAEFCQKTAPAFRRGPRKQHDLLFRAQPRSASAYLRWFGMSNYHRAEINCWARLVPVDRPVLSTAQAADTSSRSGAVEKKNRSLDALATALLAGEAIQLVAFPRRRWARNGSLL